MANTGWKTNPVSVTFWNDLKVREWSEDARQLALYFLTCEHRKPEGFYHLGMGTAAEDLKWSAERLYVARETLTEADFVDIDPAPRVVFVVKALKYSATIRGKSSIQGALNQLDRVQGTPRLFDRFLKAATEYQPDLARAILLHYRLSPVNTGD